MKNNNLPKASYDSFTELTKAELLNIEGGSFWGDLFYVAGVTAKCIWVFSKTAAEFQTSLPANLKK